ncbi:MAG: HAMP domain-containing histidine kinase, partial [Clostridia bacterium]|nr:HAMP domain-containing histidine kinase [Clostridia bacterium]
LFAGLTFAVLLLFLLMLAAFIIIFVKTDLLSIASGIKINGPLLIFLFVLFCLVVGAGVSFLLSRILTGPINRIINTINQLADGNYKARLETGDLLSRHPTIIEVTDSFNRMAEQLDKTEILRSDFINNFSHEFKTPIVSIAGFAKLLKRGNLTSEQQAEYVDSIEEESLRLADMAAGVLDLTKIENQTVLGETSVFNLSEQLRNCVLLLENKWTKKGLEPELLFDEYEIRANEDLLRQVWINLLDNAVKFSEPRCAFIVSAVRENGLISVSITNTGKTIPPESLPYIFNNFYQADESHSTEGNGIGLAVAKKIVDLHGGRIHAASGNGKTVFTVTLPVVNHG